MQTHVAFILGVLTVLAVEGVALFIYGVMATRNDNKK